MTDSGYENVTKAIEDGTRGSRRISFLRLTFPE